MRMLGVAAFGLMVVGLAGAQAPAGAPAGSTGICKDGSYSTAASKDGACRGHKGVQTWYTGAPGKAAGGGSTAAMPAPTPATKPASMPAPSPASKPVTSLPAPSPAAKPAPMPAPSAAARPSAAGSSAATKGPAAAAAAKTAAPGGGAGLVWVNTESKVYHCYGTTYYGKTKAGAYMSEADAQAKGARGERGQSCTK